MYLKLEKYQVKSALNPLSQTHFKLKSSFSTTVNRLNKKRLDWLNIMKTSFS